MLHAWMCHVTHALDQNSLILRSRMSHVTYVNEACRIWGRFMSHMPWTRTHSCHVCGSVMSHMWMKHDAYGDESCHTGPQPALTHVTFADESCHIRQGGKSHMRISHVTHALNKHSLRSRLRMSHVTHVTSRICECVMTHMLSASTPICLVREWVMSHLWMLQLTQIRLLQCAAVCCSVLQCAAVCLTQMSHMWISHVTYVNESWHSYAKGPHDYSHATHMNKSCHICQRST